MVYALHGYFIGAEQWTHEIHVPQTIEGAFAQGAREMIVVLPDSKTIHNGSMYSSSVTTGDFENFIARDVVSYIDAHYRTLAERASRGLVGHSMGGYGATRIGMKHSDVFGSLYIMSPVLPSARPPPTDVELAKKLEAVKVGGRLREAAVLRACAVRLGGRLVARSEQSAVVSRSAHEGRRAAAGRARQLDRERAAGIHRSVHRQSARSIAAISIDVGDQDGLRVDTAKLHDVLDQYRIANAFESFPARTPARWRIDSRIMCCLSSASTCASNRSAARRGRIVW